MPTRHRVRAGECLSSIAARYGFFADTLWRHPENAELRDKRRNPNALLADEDVVFIPDLRAKDEERETGRRHRFRRRGVPERLRLRFLDRNGEPRAGLAYRLEIAGREHTGQTDADGWVIHSIPPDARSGRLILGDGEEEMELALGHVPPIEVDAGVVTRLHNLGYLDDEDEGEVEGILQIAIADFQEDAGLPRTGALDAATRAALDRAHES